MPDEYLFEKITGALHGLSDRQLSNLILVIRETQHERETEKILSGGK